jgi:hypothetical protein
MILAKTVAPMTGVEKIQHFVITRFNLRLFAFDKNKQSTLSDEWLSHRFDLFERYCLPSMAAQTNDDFVWFIFFDESTPDTYRQRIEAARRECPQIRPCYIKGGDFFPYLMEQIEADTDVLITTRIDNDDSFRDDALAIVRSQVSFAKSKICINFRYGLSCDGSKAEVFSQRFNPFSSLIERRSGGDFVTIFATRHGKIHQIAKVKQIVTGPHWLMCVHDRNVANKMPDDYKKLALTGPHYFKRYLKKYVSRRLRRVFWPKEFKRTYSMDELAQHFHIRS